MWKPTESNLKWKYVYIYIYIVEIYYVAELEKKKKTKIEIKIGYSHGLPSSQCSQKNKRFHQQIDVPGTGSISQAKIPLWNLQIFVFFPTYSLAYKLGGLYESFTMLIKSHI
jgi:hypothetical protein